MASSSNTIESYNNFKYSLLSDFSRSKETCRVDFVWSGESPVSRIKLLFAGTAFTLFPTSKARLRSSRMMIWDDAYEEGNCRLKISPQMLENLRIMGRYRGKKSDDFVLESVELSRESILEVDKSYKVTFFSEGPRLRAKLEDKTKVRQEEQTSVEKRKYGGNREPPPRPKKAKFLKSPNNK